MLAPENQEQNKKPCPKFVIAGVISCSAAIFGGTMLILSPTGPLAPFYASLISGALAYWMPSPSYNGNNN
jgi:hypothetical protein